MEPISQINWIISKLNILRFNFNIRAENYKKSYLTIYDFLLPTTRPLKLETLVEKYVIRTQNSRNICP